MTVMIPVHLWFGDYKKTCVTCNKPVLTICFTLPVKYEYTRSEPEAQREKIMLCQHLQRTGLGYACLNNSGYCFFYVARSLAATEVRRRPGRIGGRNWKFLCLKLLFLGLEWTQKGNWVVSSIHSDYWRSHLSIWDLQIGVVCA